MSIKSLAIIILLSLGLSLAALAKKETYLLVGITFDQLPQAEQDSLGDANLIEIAAGPGWQNYIRQSDADKVILKHPTGYVGLYSSDGMLLRQVNTQITQGFLEPQPTFQQSPPVTNNVTWYHWDQTGYQSGGRIEPYRPQAVWHKRDQKDLAPGWGYDGKRGSSKTNILYNFMSFFPLDTVTPFNYPGSWDESSIGWAYSVGSIPHIGGLAAEWRRAHNEKKQFEQASKQPPDHIEFPVQYYNPSEPSNPISRDPNQVRMEQMPQSWTQNNPTYSQWADYYGIESKPLPSSPSSGF